MNSNSNIESDFELESTLRKLRAIASGRMHLPLGDLIGAGEVAPCVVEVRMAPPGYGWLMRMAESGGQWVDVPESTWCGYEDIKFKLNISMPLHLVVWFESGGEYFWADA